MKLFKRMLCYATSALFLFVLPLMLLGCQHLPTVLPSESTSPNHPTVTYKTLCEMLDEAQEALNSRQELVVPSNYYTDMFVTRQRLVEDGVISKDDRNYIINTSALGEHAEDIRYLVFLCSVMERYLGYWEWTFFDYDAETIARKEEDGSTFTILLFTDYQKAGFDNIQEYMRSKTDIPQDSVEFKISFSWPSVSMTYMEGEYTLRYQVYTSSRNTPCLYYGTATEPSGIGGPKYPGYTGDGKPPC